MMTQYRKRNAIIICSVILALIGVSCQDFHEKILYKEANQLFNEDEYQKAIVKYEELTKSERFKKDAWLHLGYCYLSLLRASLTQEELDKFKPKAIEAFTKYLELEPKDSKVQDYLFNTYMDARDYDAALQFLFEKFNQNNKDIRAIQLIIQIYEDNAKVPEATEWYKKWMEVFPDDPNPYYSFAVFCWRNSYYNMGMEKSLRATLVDEGIETIQKAIELKPEFADAYTYWNLLLREKAQKYERNKRKKEKLISLAMEKQLKGREIREAQQAAEAEKKKEEGATQPATEGTSTADTTTAATETK